MPKLDESAGTRRLLQLCGGYFLSYIATGVAVKYFISGPPDMALNKFIVKRNLAANGIVLLFVLVAGWVHLASVRRVKIGPLSVPSELAYIIPSGICTGIIIPTTTLMYTLPISIMVAMVMMRGSVIVAGRVVDAILIRQGLLKKKVYAEENVAVVLAMAAVAVAANVFDAKGAFDFLGNAQAVVVFSAYIAAYAIRIYIMNYYKTTRSPTAPHDSRGFFAIEQIAASGTLLAFGILAWNAPSWFGVVDTRLDQFRETITHLSPRAMLAGVPFGIGAFFAVFIFLFKGRTATFAGLVNRLTSLLAGITATVIVALTFGNKWPTKWQWMSVVLIVGAVYFLTRAEKLRSRELAAEQAESTH